MTVFNQVPNDATKEPMFFGNPVNVSRFDQYRHSTFAKLTEKQLSFFWRPEEVDVSRDRIDFMKLPEHEQHIFISNLKYQTLLDSIQGRSPNMALLPIVSLPELETWIETWSFSECLAEGTEVLTQNGWKDLYSINIIDQNYKDGQSIKKEYVKYKGKVRCLETSTGAFVIRYNGVVSVTGNTIHSQSYTHILRNIFDDPSEVLDDIVNNVEIQKRAAPIASYYDDLITGVQQMQCGHDGAPSLRELKKRLYLCICSVNALEAIRFYVSFACSFAFAERDLMEGNAKVIKLIARDEALHLNSTQQMLNLWADGKDDPEMAEIAIECFAEGQEIFLQAAQQEKEWANYLFKDGSMIGVNEEILCQYVDYISNVRMKAIGYPAPFAIKDNPIPWINHWLVSDNVQVAPQEAEISSYLVGQINSSIDHDELGKFKL